MVRTSRELCAHTSYKPLRNNSRLYFQNSVKNNLCRSYASVIPRGYNSDGLQACHKKASVAWLHGRRCFIRHSSHSLCLGLHIHDGELRLQRNKLGIFLRDRTFNYSSHCSDFTYENQRTGQHRNEGASLLLSSPGRHGESLRAPPRLP